MACLGAARLRLGLRRWAGEWVLGVVAVGARGITVRVMERGGARTNYYRVNVPGKATYTATGDASTDAALTHMDIGESSLDDILSIVRRIQGAG